MAREYEVNPPPSTSRFDKLLGTSIASMSIGDVSIGLHTDTSWGSACCSGSLLQFATQNNCHQNNCHQNNCHQNKEFAVKELDIQGMGTQEQKLFEVSFQPALSEKRVRNVALSTLMTLAGVALFSIYGVGLIAITAMGLVIVAISAIEKISYAREILVYKSLVRNLAHRVEQLEGGELTPLDGHPAERARRVADGKRAEA